MQPCYSPGDGCRAQIGSVHQTRAVENAQRDDQATINVEDDLPLLFRRELVDASIVGLFRGGTLDVVIVSRLLEVRPVRV
jgi:hypothetical protein